MEYEAALHTALEAIATGATVEETDAELGHDPELFEDALAEALAQGVEEEDIDPSWFA